MTFTPGEATKAISIEVKMESNEAFNLNLIGNNSSNALFTKNRGVGTILNDD